MDVPTLAAIGLLAALVWVTVAWIASLWRSDASVMDVFWGPGFLFLAILYAALGSGPDLRSLLLVSLVTAWSLRLAWHIHRRNRGRPEDRRYRRWREEAGEGWWWKSWFRVFALQGVVMWVVSAPLLAALATPGPARLTALDALGALVWAIGLAIEAVADEQLHRFRSEPGSRGRVLRTGLWRYSRHPNYFGESLVWWGLWLVAASSQAGRWTAFSPIVMTLLLLRVSGVTLLERDIEERRPGYRDYVRRTSAFIPWPPRAPAEGPDG